MRTLQLAPHLSNEQIINNLTTYRGKPEFTRWQIFYLIQVSKVHSAELIAPLVNLSRPSIYKIVESYNKEGIGSVVLKPRGGRRRALLSIEEEQHILSLLEQRASQGLIKTANDIRSIVEQRVGKAVSDDYLWDLLQRNGWKKKVPRPHHPKGSKKEQDDFKKNSPMFWAPLL